MRFDRLSLAPYGCFADMTLEFSAASNLHVIYGSNEAGKSTTLRAIRGFLFGIETRSSDVHTFEGKKLRVRALIKTADGQRIEWARRKGNKNCLLSGRNEAPADEAVLSALLGGVGPEYFNSMFALGHGDLVKGGLALLAQGGSLGEALFGAGSGAGMRSVLSRLEDDARSLFSKTGSKPPLNRAIASFKESTKAAKTAALKPGEWKRVDKELAEARAALEATSKTRQALNTDLQRLERLKGVIPLLVSRDGYRAELAALPSLPSLPRDCTIERQKSETLLAQLDLEHERLAAEETKNSSELSALGSSVAAMSSQHEIDCLAEAMGVYNKGQRDLASLRSRASLAESETEELLRSLGREVRADSLETMRVSEPAKARVRELAMAKGELVTRMEACASDEARVYARIDELERERQGLAANQNCAELARALKEAQKQGDLERRLAALLVQESECGRELEISLSALGRFEGSAKACCALPLPSRETVEEHGSAIEKCEHGLQEAKSHLLRLQEQEDAVIRAIARLQASGEVPTLAHLREIRRLRDLHWSEVKSAWLSADEPTSAGKSLSLAENYSVTVVRSDLVADRLRDDAERTGRLVSLELERNQVCDERARQEERVSALEQHRCDLQDRWRALWEPAELAVGTPTEMRGWLRAHEKFVEGMATARALEREQDSTRTTLGVHRTHLGTALEGLGEKAVAPGETMAALLERSQGVCERAEAQQRARLDCARNLDEAQRLLVDARGALPRAQQSMSEWQNAWGVSMSLLGLSADAGASEAEAVISGVSAALEKWREVGQSRLRIVHIERDAEEFSARVESLVKKCAPTLAGKPVESAAAALLEILAQERRDQNVRTHLQERREALAAKRSEVERERERHGSVLGKLMSAAGASDLEELRRLEAAARVQGALRAKLAEAEESLLRVGVAISKLESEAQDVSIDSLPGSIEEITERLRESESEVRGHYENLADLKKEREAMDGSSAAASAAEDAEAARSDIRSMASEYARLLLARHLLGAEIERYRKKNQGPVLARASEMFRRITLENFRGLGTDFNSKDELILVCERENGAAVEVAGLSDGTRDQLFLSLRLASLELHASKNEPLPLIMDDLLVNFDQERSLATMALLGEVARSSQILFFTHHKPMLEIARSALPEGSWSEHRLSSSADSV